MIEVCDENIYYTKKRKKNGKQILAFFLFFIILFGILFYYNKVVNKEVYRYCLDYLEVYSLEALNNAVLDSLTNEIEYNSLVNIEKNNNGDIVLMSANSFEVNKLSRKIVSLTSLYLKNKLETGVPVPLLAFSGIPLLSGYGKKINIKTMNLTSVGCGFVSDFKSVGINQTLHSIYIEIICKSNMSVLFSKREVNSKTSVLICETVLVGKVPEIYLNGKLFG